MPAPSAVLDLVERFDRNIDQYKKAQNETQVRREFIDPLFTELGWDMDNRGGAAPQYQDVIHEDQIKIGGRTKAPDYGFRIGGSLKFFVEAKKPSVFVKEMPGPAYQVRSYAWSAKLPLSVVTDFEEFAVYDCSQKPNEGDKPSIARVNYLTYKDYADKWDEINGVFSRDAIYKGSFDKYAEGIKGKRGTTTVDKAFLAEIERFRELLAKNFAKNNRLSEEELKFAVQRTLDRIIFLRICESRGIEEEGRLLDQVVKGDIYKNLFTLFNAADNRYNSGLFYFRKGDKAHTSDAELDTITSKLKLDDKILKDIVEHLYYPKSPYQFDVIPADILGQVYEQFLGKVIRMTPGGLVKIEEKPEVRKAGGVYYTPTYIVNYIVNNTVGKLLESRSFSTAQERNKITLTVLDPACGSGSFLLGGYDHLLKWYLSEYVKKADFWLKQKQAPIFTLTTDTSDKTASYSLTTHERKRILLEHIYGVDIDEQAVEVAKLNLMLKCLEGESRQSLKLSVERLLPDLSDNIKCGNSLIGPDFYSSDLFKQGGKDFNAFDWTREYAEIMNTGGFDAVVGNPPYGAITGLDEDSYISFMKHAVKFLKDGGLLSFIVPTSWLTGVKYIATRDFFFTQYGINKVVSLPFNIFRDAYIDTCLFVFTKSVRLSEMEVFEFGKKERIVSVPEDLKYSRVKLSEVLSDENKTISTNSFYYHLRKKFRNQDFTTIGEESFSSRGVEPNHKIYADRKTNTHPYFIGRIDRYVYEKDEERYIDLSKHKPDYLRYYFDTRKIWVKRIISRQDRMLCTIPPENFVLKKDYYTFTFDNNYSLEYYLSLLNSRLLSYIYIHSSAISSKDDFRQTTLKELRALPIPKIDLSKDSEKATHDKLAALANNILKLNAALRQASIPQDKTRLERQIAATDAEIDRLVYELYKLTEEEIMTVEGAK